jgi:hypothetical protein
VRLQKFLSGDYRNVVMLWRKDFEQGDRQAAPKESGHGRNPRRRSGQARGQRPLQPRCDQIQSKGLALGPGVREQMKSKHSTTLENEWSSLSPATSSSYSPLATRHHPHRTRVGFGLMCPPEHVWLG